MGLFCAAKAEETTRFAVVEYFYSGAVLHVVWVGPILQPRLSIIFRCNVTGTEIRRRMQI